MAIMLSHAASYQSYRQNRWLQSKRAQTLGPYKRPEAKFAKQLKPTQEDSLPKQIMTRAAQENIFLFPTIQKDVQDLLNKKIPLQILKTTPVESLGSGNEGIVFLCADENQNSSALKIHLKAISTLGKTHLTGDTKMAESFQQSRALMLMLKSLPESPHLIAAKGLAYVEEFNVWGIVYEKIDGKKWSEFRDTLPFEKFVPFALKAMLGSARAFRILDQAGFPQKDIKRGHNLLIRPDGSPVVIDINLANKPESYKRERAEFGELFQQSLMQALGKLKPEQDVDVQIADLCNQINDLCSDCLSEKNMDEFGWQQVIDRLESIQHEYAKSVNHAQ